MTVAEKIEKKRAEIEQERAKDGKYKKSHDPFLLWGEYPHGWQMIKDLILCLMLLNALISQLKQIDLAGMMAEAPEIASVATIQPAEASTVNPEPKTQETTKSEATGEFSAYNSEENQTDSDPYTMASGKRVYAGAVANNCLPFGTKIKVNGKVKVIEDRMNSRYGCEHFDIWMAEYDDAIAFGRKTMTYEVIQ